MGCNRVYSRVVAEDGQSVGYCRMGSRCECMRLNFYSETMVGYNQIYSRIIAVDGQSVSSLLYWII